ncbi:MAG: rRNA adenine N-6-methyltransferase family protein, partial [Actinomycetales bacterium]
MGDVTLLGAAEIRAIAAELALRPSKAYGQNFVIDPNTVRRIVRQAQVEPGTCVLEVGPGLGSLTLGLLDAGLSVLALEIDIRLAGQLASTVLRHAPSMAEHLRVEKVDALR